MSGSSIASAENKRNPLSTVLTHSVTVAIRGLVAWGVTTLIAWKEASTDQDRYELEAGRDKVAIIELVKEREPTLALALLDYYDARFGKTDAAFKEFLEAISAYIDSSAGSISNQQEALPLEQTDSEVARLSKETIRDQLFSANRRVYAEKLVKLFESSNDDTDKKKIVSVLLDSIIPSDGDQRRRYRTNLYIALTFSLLPRVGMTQQELDLLEKLETYKEYRDDPTFKQNVENAITKQRAA